MTAPAISSLPTASASAPRPAGGDSLPPIVAYRTPDKLAADVPRFERAVQAVEQLREEQDAAAVAIRDENKSPRAMAKALAESDAAYEAKIVEATKDFRELGPQLWAELATYHMKPAAIEAIASREVPYPLADVVRYQVLPPAHLEAEASDLSARFNHERKGLLRGVVLQRSDLSPAIKARLIAILDSGPAPGTIGPAKELARKIGGLRARFDIALLGGPSKVTAETRLGLFYKYRG